MLLSLLFAISNSWGCTSVGQFFDEAPTNPAAGEWLHLTSVGIVTEVVASSDVSGPLFVTSVCGGPFYDCVHMVDLADVSEGEVVSFDNVDGHAILPVTVGPGTPVVLDVLEPASVVVTEVGNGESTCLGVPHTPVFVVAQRPTTGDWTDAWVVATASDSGLGLGVTSVMDMRLGELLLPKTDDCIDVVIVNARGESGPVHQVCVDVETTTEDGSETPASADPDAADLDAVDLDGGEAEANAGSGCSVVGKTSLVGLFWLLPLLVRRQASPA